jgi:hypothetical protein
MSERGLSEEDVVALGALGLALLAQRKPEEKLVEEGKEEEKEVAPQVSLKDVVDAINGLKPARKLIDYTVKQQAIAPNSYIEFAKRAEDGWSALVIIVKVTYSVNASAGVKIRWMYSPDGSNFDSPEEADNQGNYYNMTYGAGVVRQTTVVVPLLTPFVKIQIFNQDASNSVIADVWTVVVR